MESKNRKKEALRKKSLGELGELFAIKVLIDNGFEKVKNLNDKKMNFPYADLYAEKDDIKYVISIKARNKYQRNGKVNSSYNLGKNAYNKAEEAANEYGAKAYWMAVQFDEASYSVYFGSIEELNGRNFIPVNQCSQVENSMGVCFVKDRKHYFDFSFFKNK